MGEYKSGGYIVCLTKWVLMLFKVLVSNEMTYLWHALRWFVDMLMIWESWMRLSFLFSIVLNGKLNEVKIYSEFPIKEEWICNVVTATGTIIANAFSKKLVVDFF